MYQVAALPGPGEGPGLSGERWGPDGFSDGELTVLALAADPNQVPDHDARPLSFYQPPVPGGLPEWYMPPVAAHGWRGWRLAVVMAVIAGFLLVDAFGLCITYGQLVFA